MDAVFVVGQLFTPSVGYVSGVVVGQPVNPIITFRVLLGYTVLGGQLCSHRTCMF